MLHRASVGAVPAAFLTVTNTGPRVDPADLPRLFEPFQRADGSDGRHPGGLGLGLSIVRAVASAHHAGIEAMAEPGGGLAVTLTFPARTGR